MGALEVAAGLGEAVVGALGALDEEEAEREREQLRRGVG